MTMLRARLRRKPSPPVEASQAGFVTVEFVAGMALLLFPVAMLVMTLPTWFERQSMTRVAAREAAREYVLSGDRSAANQVVQEIEDNYTLPDNTMSATFTVNDGAGGDTRGGSIRAVVRTHVPVVQVPIFGYLGDFDITSTHTEPIDLYRSQQ